MKLTKKTIWSEELMSLKEDYEFFRLIYRTIQTYGVDISLIHITYSNSDNLKNMLTRLQRAHNDELEVLEDLWNRFNYEGDNEFVAAMKKRIEDLKIIRSIEL